MGDEEGKSLWKRVALCDSHLIEWAHGDSWGHENTVLLRGKTVIRRRCSNSGPSFIESVYKILCDKRHEWDPACISVQSLEEGDAEFNSDSMADAINSEMKRTALEVKYDIVEYNMHTAIAETKFCLLRAGAFIQDHEDIIDETKKKEEGDKSKLNKSKKITSAVFASRSVIHEKSDARNRVLPSGWLLKSIVASDPSDNDGNNGGEEEKTVKGDDTAGGDYEAIEITYISELDFNELRNNTLDDDQKKNASDEYIANFIGSYISQWFTNLASSFDR